MRAPVEKSGKKKNGPGSASQFSESPVLFSDTEIGKGEKAMGSYFPRGFFLTNTGF